MRRCDPVRLSIPAVLLAALLCAVFPLAGWGQTATQTLLRKASSLEGRGRIDLAALTWEQVLLVDPASPEALAGLARAAKLAGHREEASGYLERLRAMNPDDPNLGRIQKIGAQEGMRSELDQAARFAAAGQYTQAMSLYRAVFGATPPPGEPALAYYETEAATGDGRAHAVAGLRGLAERSPGDARYAIALGRILTYDGKTRAEGRRVLQRYPHDAKAVEALRQALVWDASKPASAGDLRAYLAVHPDPQLAQLLRQQPRVAQTTTVRHPPVIGKTRTNEEEAAYRDLNAGNIGRAEMLFRALLDRHPRSGPALAGMGYIRMQQGNFGGAISFLTEAQQAGIDDVTMTAALDTARFWYTMGEGLGAMTQNDWATAEKQYQAALGLRPGSPEALDGLGRALLKGRHADRAAEVYARLTQAQPGSAAAWGGLVQAQAAAGNPTAAVATDRTVPAALHEQLMRDPGYVGGVAAAYAAAGQDAEARRILDDALDLPFPPGGRGLEPATELEFASLLLQAGRLDQAAGLYRQMLAADHGNAAAGAGLVRVLHAAHRDADALQTIEAIPPVTYGAATRDAGFDGTVAEVFVAQGKLERAQSVLEQAIARLRGAGETVPPELEVALAGVQVRRGAPEVGYALDQRVLAAHPERVDAWRGLVAAMQASGRDRDALVQIRQIAPVVRLRLESDPTYLRTVADVYRALGDPGQASVFLTRILQIDLLDQVTSGADLELEEARLLLNAGDDASLYAALHTLDARGDLTSEQRGTVETIWAAWAVGRSRQLALGGDARGGAALLDAAATAFPRNRAVLRLIAGGYCMAGEPERAVALYRRTSLAGATAGEYQAALTAALGANETRQAKSWLREGLAAYPQDAQLLLLAARMERVGGSAKRAAALYHSALAVMPLETSASGGEGSSGDPVNPGELGALLAPASGLAGLRYPPLPPLIPGYAVVAPPRAVRQTAPSAGASPRLRDYVPVASLQSSGTLRASMVPGLQIRTVSALRSSGERSSLMEAVARGPSEAFSGPYVREVSPAGRREVVASMPGLEPGAMGQEAQTDDARRGQSHPPEEDFSFGGAAAASSSVQIPQPARPPGGTHGQQYPQPRRVVSGRRRSRALPERALLPPRTAEPPVSALVAAPVLPLAPEAPVSRFPSMSYPMPGEVVAGGGLAGPRGLGGEQPPAAGASRRDAEAQLAALEASYSGSATGTGMARVRTGASGLDRLTDLETPVELSAVLGRSVRAAVIPRGVFLNSGIFDGAGGGTVPVLGTRPASAALAPPIANGVGGEAQVVTANYGFAAGYTPYEFPVHTVTARVRMRPSGGPVTVTGERQPVKQTQLSYAGLRDPGAPGNVWGGVVATGGSVRVELGDVRAAYTLFVHGARLTGRHVLVNTAFDAAVAADFRLHSWVRAGTLRLGGDLEAEHFTHNERGLSYGQGGYFSPNYQVVAAVPVSFQGRSRRGLQYRVSAAGGFQTYQERAALFYPLDAGLQAGAVCAPTTSGCAMYPLRGNISGHYAVDADGVYRLGDHWAFGGSVSANNTRFYHDVSTGFSFRYLFTPQVEIDGMPPGLLPREGFVPLHVP